MLRSVVITLPINRAYDEAYGIISQPENYKLWSPVLDARFEAHGNNGLDWRVELPSGLSILRFSAPNDYGVLDYKVMREDGTGERTTALRLVRNQEGCELIIVFFQQPEQSDEAFASYVEWAQNDFMALKSVVETV